MLFMVIHGNLCTTICLYPGNSFECEHIEHHNGPKLDECPEFSSMPIRICPGMTLKGDKLFFQHYQSNKDIHLCDLTQHFIQLILSPKVEGFCSDRYDAVSA